MSIFDSITPKKSLGDTLAQSESRTIVVEDKNREIVDLETGLQSINPATNPYATAVLQSELRKLKETI